MKKIISLMLIIGIAIMIIADLRYSFGNYDTAFVTVLLLDILYLFIHRSTKFNVLLAVLLVVGMSISYIHSGSIRLTERMGEWFYIFFVFGLIQYGKETFFGKNKKTS